MYLFDEPWLEDSEGRTLPEWIRSLEAIVMEAESLAGKSGDESAGDFSDRVDDLLSETQETQEEIYQFVESMKSRVERLKKELQKLRK